MNRASMYANDTIGHCQPESGPTRLTVAIVCHAIKRSKDIGKLRLWNPGAVIAYRKENERGACLLHLRMNIHRRVGVGIADRIADDLRGSFQTDLGRLTSFRRRKSSKDER